MVESHRLLRSMISLPLVVCLRMMWLRKVKTCPPILVVDLFLTPEIDLMGECQTVTVGLCSSIQEMLRDFKFFIVYQRREQPDRS